MHLFPKRSHSYDKKASQFSALKDLESLEFDKDGEESTKRVFLIHPM